MNHNDHMNLLRGGVPEKAGGLWADFGSGGGAFTLALAELLGPGGEIYSIDQDGGALRRQGQTMAGRYPDVKVHFMTADFARPLSLPALDGIVMANALHFVRKKDSVVTLLKSYLKPQGRLVIVEYNTDRGNLWVPHPFSFPRWQEMARKAGFGRTELLKTTPSSYLGEFYSAVSW